MEKKNVLPLSERLDAGEAGPLPPEYALDSSALRWLVMVLGVGTIARRELEISISV